jgi:hypothetical protein
MNQTLLELESDTTEPLDRVGFDIGWDHARHAQVPPAELLLDGTPIGHGWRAGRAVFGRRMVASGRGVRQWLALRIEAWRGGVAFETLQVTPHFLGQIEVRHCPVTRQPLGGTGGGDTAPVIVRLREDAGYAAGNLVMLSRVAARAKTGCTALQVSERSRGMAREPGASFDGLDAAAWGRLATLMCMAVELPQAQAARLPLLALPANRVRVLNPAQGLQALLTLRLQAAGWSRRARAVADLLPRPTLRHDFNLFVGALAARLMSIPEALTGSDLRWAQEDAWTDGRVQRRWAQFAIQLTADESESLLARLADAGLGGVRLMVHAGAAATDGWSLPTQGRLLQPVRSHRRGTVPASSGTGLPIPAPVARPVPDHALRAVASKWMLS